MSDSAAEISPLAEKLHIRANQLIYSMSYEPIILLRISTRSK